MDELFTLGGLMVVLATAPFDMWAIAFWLLGAVVAVLLVVGAIVAARAFIRRRTRRRVAESSAALEMLGRLNHRFEEAVAPLPPISFSFEVRLDSKPKFDAFNLGRRFREEVLQREQFIAEQMDLRRQVLRHYLDYEARVGAEAMPKLGRSERPDVPKDRFDVVEGELFTELLLDRPTPQARILGVARYTSPQGRNSYEESHEWGFDDLRQEMGLAREDRERRSTTQFLRERERSLMTPKLRIDVLQRDGRRCRACGATADDATLHIDHIVPVSRGGLTEMSNLQVLCQSCNLGKSNRFVG